ncbi:DNA polymerase sliding clamp [Halorubellus sp. PRR65]|uniref:DNA polymerase sliding clamp n=1 Tax=Halorubellus sp. PRR65 TaxID=3098148 RepID=UPI002B25C2AB|nr:DNA polymerase sliding clamp [Halorubellus sp. PRR65]
MQPDTAPDGSPSTDSDRPTSRLAGDDPTARPEDDPLSRLDVEDVALHAIAPASTLAAVLDAASVVVDECIVDVSADGLAITAIDAATVGMVDLELRADAFDAYDATAMRFGVALDRLQDVLALADRDDPVELAVDATTRTLHVRIGELAYQLALIDPDAVRSPPDTVAIAADLDGTVTVDGRVLARAIDAADMVADTLELGLATDPDRLYAHADGDADTVDFDRAASDCHAFDPAPGGSLFSVGYLTALTPVLPDDAPVDVHLDEDAPVAFSYDVADGDGRIQLLVAPRLSRT